MRLVKALFEFHPDGILVVALADEDNLVFAIAVAGIPIFTDFGVFCKVRLLLVFAQGVYPKRYWHDRGIPAGLFEQLHVPAGVREPDVTFGTDQFRGVAVVDEIHETGSVERLPGLENERRNSVFVYAAVATASGLQQACGGFLYGRGRFDLTVVERFCRKDFFDVDVAVYRMDNRGAGLEIAYDGFDFFELVFAEQIALVQDDEVAEFNLVYNQGGNFFLGKIVLVGEMIPLLFFMFQVAEEFAVDAVSIDDGDDGGEVDVCVGVVFFVGQEACTDGAGIADAGGFDEYDFDRIQFGNLFDLFNKFVAEGAANAAVLQFEHRTFGHVRAVLFQNFGIDVDASHVVDDKGDFSFLLLENIVQERGLAGAQISGNEDDGFLVLFHGSPLWFDLCYHSIFASALKLRLFSGITDFRRER